MESKLVLVIEKTTIEHHLGSPLDKAQRGAIAEAFQYMKTLSHPNLCCYTDMLRIDGNTYMLVSEGYSLSLEDLIKPYPADATFRQANIATLDFDRIVHQLICGIQYLHANGMPHGSLGLHDIFVNRDGDVKIGCYGPHYLKHIAYKNRVDVSQADETALSGCYTGNYNGHCMARESQHEDCHVDPRHLLYFPPDVSCVTQSIYDLRQAMNNDVWALGICLIQIIASIMECEQMEGLYDDAKPIKGTTTTKLFDDITMLLKCQRQIRALRKALIDVSKMFQLIRSRLPPESGLSNFGIDVIGMCEDVLSIHEKNDGKTRSTDERIIGILLMMHSCDNDVASLNNGVNPSCKVNGDIHIYKHKKGGDTGLPESNGVYTVGDEHRFLDTESHVAVIQLVLEWVAGSKLVDDLVHFTGIDLSIGEIDNCKRQHPYLEHLFYLLKVACKCLTINPEHRPRVLDLLLMSPRRTETLNTNEQWMEHMDPIWTVTSLCSDASSYPDRRMQIADFFTLKYKKRSIEVSGADIVNMNIDDVFYFWRLMGNSPFDVLKTTGHVSTQSFHIVSIEDMVNKIKKADLFPMIVEHQIRPTCGYARQFTFLYQWIRIRRFNKMLSKGFDNKDQIMIESQVDIPYALRKQIWCVLLGVTVAFNPPMSEITSSEPHDKAIVAEIRKVLNKYDNDILHSERCLMLMISAANRIRNTYSLESLPSSIYIVLVHLVLVYYDFAEILSEVATQIFEKYLKNYYIPSGSFVQNELAEFNTMLNFFLPEVAAHLRQLGALAESFVIVWFMTLFSSSASFQQVFLLWDAIFTFPSYYIKYVAVMAIGSAKEGILHTKTAATAISCISGVINSINVPMLNYMASHTFLFWNDILFPKVSSKYNAGRRGRINQEATPSSQAASGASETNVINEERCSLDRITFTFNSDNYPHERCFKVNLRQFSELLDTCIIIDLRSLESYKLGHIPYSCHVERLFKCLGKRDEASIVSLVNDLLKENQRSAKPFDANRLRKNEHVHRNFQSLLRERKAPLDSDAAADNTILIAVGDGAEAIVERNAVERLIYEFHIPHVCYYRVNNDDWPKFFTISQM